MRGASLKEPQVSVILPVRNAAPTLDECLRSINEQSLDSYDVVVVDDGSSDESAEIVRDHARPACRPRSQITRNVLNRLGAS